VQVERVGAAVVVEQLLGEEDADDVVLVLADDRKARVPSSLEITSIWERGIMMSRAVASDTESTPSIIDSASASISLCS